ncbi:hypothetical protein [Phytohabitans suffuscus]|uniref:Uncharacterized protein n=1 Tax=Phytohabitans suffuscus TaxID=624315 RepID=A0A6F8YIF5_9ACTN|nr:hypothetical protein [Phytohabitans suffuscus]BCB85860.1 hypothetical protein Psuf_031730 [Phytohabitans suffuscus]
MEVAYQTHTDPNGHPWRITVLWETADGAARPVGLELRATEGKPGGVLTAAVLRSLRIGDLIEASRPPITWTVPREPTQPRPTGPGRPAERGDDFIAEVAALYREAKAKGGLPARKPWRYVAEQLQAQGVNDVTDGQLRNWSRRAKNLGLLPRELRTPREEKE